jgi:hypothetical protein
VDFVLEALTFSSEKTTQLLKKDNYDRSAMPLARQELRQLFFYLLTQATVSP